MKAIILAGGEGTRLRPLSCHRPKPMIPLFDKPVLEHIIHYLRHFGITEICATLQTMPYVISDCFGDGTAFGVHIEYAVETTPLGTAGGVKACRDFVGHDEDFLVISGDAVLDLDLGPALRLHKECGALATLVLHRQPQLLEYGLVMTDETGRITRFIEKPSWGQVFCDTVNTGIYILRPEALDRIPEGRFFDFARDLFPLLLRERKPIYGQTAEGYWCDMGDADAYRQCCFDALDGKVSLNVGAPLISDRVWSHITPPNDTKIIPPCYIGPDVYLGRNVTLGPYAVVGRGCSIGDHTRVEYSMMEGIQMDAGSQAQGAIAGQGTTLRNGARLCEGAVLGENVLVGAHAVIGEDTRIWPGKEIESGARVLGSLVAGQQRRPAVFDGRGMISGQPNVDITPDFCLHLGAACAELAERKPVGLGFSGGEAARVTALALETGICAAGGRVARHDADTPACAAFAARDSRWSISLYVQQQTDRVNIFCFESDGLPLRHLWERKLDGAVARGEFTLAHTRGIGGSQMLDSIRPSYIAAAAGTFRPQRTLHLSVPGTHAAASLLRATLQSMGCQVSAVGGTPILQIDESGFSLTLVDELGRTLPYERLQAILAMLSWEDGLSTVSLPYHAPALLDTLAGQWNGTLLRLGRDGDEARRHLSDAPWFTDGVFAAATLVRALPSARHTFAALSDRLPPFAVSVREIELHGDRGRIMRKLAASGQVESAELYDGLRARVKSGWVHVAPLPERRALRIIGEASTTELAAELCADFHQQTKALDSDNI